MKKRVWNKRIPTVVAFLFLIFSIGVTSYFIQKGIIFIGRASPDKAPQNVTISNVTDTSFTATFTTASESVTGISVESETDKPRLVYDVRDTKSGSQKAFLSHFITVSGLSPKTTYRFSILSEGETYTNQGQPYTAITGDKITTPPTTTTDIKGSVLLPQGGAATDTIIEFRAPGSQIITALTADDGKYTIPTSTIRNSNFNDYADLTGNSEINLTARRGSMKSTIRTLFTDATNVPPITLEEAYDFTQVSIQQESTSSSQLTIPKTTQLGAGELKITIPAPSQSFIDASPRLSGTAIPNQDVKITIQPNSVTATVRSATNGLWSYRPTTPLAPGQHTVTVLSPDRFGIVKTTSQVFSIFQSGSQITQTATPSATLTPTKSPTPTLTPTRTPTPSPTAKITPSVTVTTTPIPSATPTTAVTPTIAATPTSAITPTLAATAAPTSPPTIQPTAAPTRSVIVTPPPTGNNSSIILTAVSVILIFAGASLLFLL